MKQLYLVLLVLCAASMTVTSCLKKDDVVMSSDCGIISFKVGNISSDFTYTDKNGNTHTERRVIEGSSILFDINQVKGTITTVDSLPLWTNLRRVCPTIVCHGNPYLALPDGMFQPINSGSDSLDFSSPVTITIGSTDGQYRKDYRLSMLKHMQESDTLVWTAMNNCNLKLDTDDFTPVQFGDSLYIFAACQDGKTRETASIDGITWTEPEELVFDASLTPKPKIIPSTITVFSNRIYATDADGKLYATDPSMAWNVVDTGDRTFRRTIASDEIYLYAINATGDTILASKDMKKWKCAGTADLDKLPTTFIASASSQSTTNPKQQVCSLFGVADHSTNECVAWFKVSSEYDDTDQSWNYINPVSWNYKYPMPKLEHPTFAGTEGVYFLTGGDYRRIWKSVDYGITWYEQKSVYGTPEALNSANGVARFVLLDDLTLFIIQNGGRVWTGTLRI